MKQALLDLLVDTRDQGTLTPNMNASEIITGALTAADGAVYAVHRGIPRFIELDDDKQAQTRDAFSFKWQKRDTYEDPNSAILHGAWMLERYGFESLEAWAAQFSMKRRILDLGCGSGWSSSMWLNTPGWSGDALWVGADISTAVDVAQDRLRHIANVHFVQADALHLPFADGTFDVIFSEGVLHHTPSTRIALHSGARVLAPGGEFYFYVYRRKAPIREFTDDYVRQAIRDLSDEETWEQMRSLTQLGRALSELQVQVDVPDVPILDIKAGRYDVQRFIYWNFAKLFWNSALPFENNVHINFDWYRPQYAHRQSEEEIRAWCTEANLRIERLHEQESGYTVKAIKE